MQCRCGAAEEAKSVLRGMRGMRYFLGRECGGRLSAILLMHFCCTRECKHILGKICPLALLLFVLASVTVPFFNSLELVKESSEVSDFHTHKYCSTMSPPCFLLQGFYLGLFYLSHFAGGSVSYPTWVGSTTQNAHEALSL